MMNSKIKIIFFTGNRSEFGLMVPIIKRVMLDSNMEYELIVSGAHLFDRYGYSIKEIEKERIYIHHQIDVNSCETSNHKIIEEMAIILTKVSKIIRKAKPNYFFVLGDRHEAFAAAQAAFYNQTPIAHSGGGNITNGGCFDDVIRHAITKLSSIHFVTCKENANNVIGLGEEGWRICISGSPAVETILKENLLTKDELSKELAIDFCQPVILFTQHPVSTEWQNARKQVIQSLIALEELGYQTIITYPNSDVGSDLIIDEYQNWLDVKHFKFIKNLGRIPYLSLMKYSSVVVGNSSSGLLETPIFKVPAINVGSRQKGRVRSTNVIDVGYDNIEIKNAINKAIFDEKFLKDTKNCTNPFAVVNTSEIIINKLKELLYHPKLSKVEFDFYGYDNRN